MIQSYAEAKAVEGYDDVQEADREKIQRAWAAGAIAEEDKGPSEPVDTGKKKAAPRKKKADDEDGRPKKRAKKAKVRESFHYGLSVS